MLIDMTPEQQGALRTVLAVATDEVDRASAGSEGFAYYSAFYRARIVLVELLTEIESAK